MARRVPVAQARKRFASLLGHSVAGERIQLTRYNKTVAVLIPKQDFSKLEDCESGRSRARAGK
jgi:prevent-host-death family protein